MRRALSAFLVLMLVLRGLLGDAMAMGLMAGGHATAQTAAPQAKVAQAANDMPADQATPHHAHPAHHAQAPAVSLATATVQAEPAAHCASPAGAAHHAPAGDGDASGHTHCSACGICHSPLGAAASAGLPSAAPVHAAPLAHATAFASAALAQVAKPPIS